MCDIKSSNENIKTNSKKRNFSQEEFFKTNQYNYPQYLNTDSNIKSPSILSSIDKQKQTYQTNELKNCISPGTGDEQRMNSKSKDVINSFKEVLKESEKFTHIKQSTQQYQINQNYRSFSNSEIKSPQSPKSMYIEPNDHPSQVNSFILKINSNNLRDENERLKISNQVLNKSNLDLKNHNKILLMELEALQGNELYNYTNNLNFDKNLKGFIENLKNALNSSQMSNSELSQIIENLQKKIFDITAENGILKDQNEVIKSESENLKKYYQESKLNIEGLINDNRKLENELAQSEIKLREKDQKISDDNERIENLMLLNENYNKNKSDLNVMIENLKNTMEIMKKTNNEQGGEKTQYKVKLDKLDAENENLLYEIENMKSKIKSETKDKEYALNEMKIIQDEINNKEKYIKDLQENYKILLADMENFKTKIEISNYNNLEKDHTIENLKSSLNFITENFQEYKNELETLKNINEREISEKNKLSKNYDLYEKKTRDSQNLIENLLISKDELMKRNIEVENELNDKKARLNQILFMYDIINKKYDDQVELVNKLKEENKNSKINKISEDFSINFMKNNDEKVKKINDLIAEVNSKNNILEELKKNYEETIILKDEKINKMNLDIENLMKTQKEKGKKEISYLNEINILKSENEKLKLELKSYKIQLENKIAVCKSDIECMNLESFNSSPRKTNIMGTNDNLNLAFPRKIIVNENNEVCQEKILSAFKKELNTYTNNFKQIKNINENSIQNRNREIYAVYDNRRILGFNFLSKTYKLYTYENITNFSENFNSEGMITLNANFGLFIVTGSNSDLFYFYDPTKNVIILLQTLNYNHANGGLIYNPRSNTIICLSGRLNKKVEKYSNDVLLKRMYKSKSNQYFNQTDQWNSLPDMIHDRTNAGYIIVNEKIIFSIFGFCYSKGNVLNSIEKLNLEQDYLGSNFQWEEVKLQLVPNTCYFKSLYALYLNSNDEVLIYGGLKENNSIETKKILKFNFYKCIIEESVDSYFPDNLLSLNFTKENVPLTFMNANNENIIAIIDNSFKVHIVDPKRKSYDVINYSY